MNRSTNPPRGIAPARHLPSPASGWFGFTKSDIDQINRDGNTGRTSPPTTTRIAA